MLLSSPVRATETSAQTRRGSWTRLAAVLAACAASWLATLVAVVPLGAVPQTARAAASGGLEVLEVRPNFFLLAGAGGSIGVQVGEDGAVVVDAGSAASAAAVVEAIKRITPKPIRYVIDTGPDADHVGGNEVLSKAGEADIRSGRKNPMGAPILAAEGVLRHMSSTSGSTPAYPASAWPTETFHYARKYMYLERRSDRGAAPARSAHRQRRLRLLSPIGRRGGRRRARHAAVSRHRRRARRQHPGRDRGAEPPGRSRGALGADCRARGRHGRHSRPRPVVRPVPT